MKHIKQFEDNNASLALDKYITTDYGEILEIITNEYLGIIEVKRLYKYNYLTDKFNKLKDKNIYSSRLKYTKTHLLYTSNNIPNCKQYFILYLQSNKYNL